MNAVRFAFWCCAWVATCIFLACIFGCSAPVEHDDGCTVPLAALDERIAGPFWQAAERWENATGCRVVPDDNGMVVLLEEQPRNESTGEATNALYRRRDDFHGIVYKESEARSPDAAATLTHELGHRLGFRGHFPGPGLMGDLFDPHGLIDAAVLERVCEFSACLLHRAESVVEGR